MDKEYLVIWINEQMRQSKTDSSAWRKQARECYDFYSSKQWSDEDMAILEEQGRPPVVFNRVARTINAISGLEVQNRQEVRYIPRETNDSAVNEILTAAAKWVRDNCDAEDEESEAFQDTLICGMGWTDTSLDYETSQDGKIIIERDDPLSYYWDTQSKKRNIDDAKWCAKVYRYSTDQIKEQWPDWDGTASSSEEFTDEVSVSHDATLPFYDGGSTNKSGVGKQQEVICFQWYEKVSVYRVQVEDKIITLSEAKYAAVKDSLQGVKVVKQPARKYMKAYVIGDTLLEKKENEVEGFTFRCITGMRDRNNNMWFGLVGLMMDPQRWANKWLSQIMHIVNSNSKGGLLAETDAFADIRKAEAEWSNPQAINWLRPGGLGKIQQKTMPQMPTAIHQLLQYALESISDVPGVNAELLGLADRQQAGVLEASRKQAGVTMLAIFFDSLRRYRKEQGRILAEFIVKYIADGRLIRIVGDNGAQVVPLLKDPMTFEYDIVVDDAPTSPNQKERVFAMIMQGLPQFQAAGMPPPPAEILDYMPLPESIINKWKQKAQPELVMQMQQMQQAMEQAGMQMQQMQQMLQQTQMENHKLSSELQGIEIQKQQADVEIEVAKLDQRNKELEISLMDAQTRRLEAETKVVQANAKINVDSSKQSLEEAKLILDNEKNNIESNMQMTSDGGREEDMMMADMHRQLSSINEGLKSIHQCMMMQKQPIGITVVNAEMGENPEEEAKEGSETSENDSQREGD